MLDYLRNWYQRNFSDPQAAFLALALLSGFAVILVMGDIIAPIIASVIIAYVLSGGVNFLEKRNTPSIIAVTVVFSLFMAFLILFFLGLTPVLTRQMAQFVRELPVMIGKGQQLLMQLPQNYPDFFTEQQIQELLSSIKTELAFMGQAAVKFSVSSVLGLITLMVYMILVPLMVFFFLKDKQQIVRWLQGFLPKERRLSTEVWKEVNLKIGSYIRGKFTEILIVWVVTYITFAVLGLSYAMLLSFLVGISVIVPYVGAAVVTIPVAFVAYIQWGVGSEFIYVLIAYGVIQFFDGNLLVPLLFSEVVNLHPVAIIAAVLVFGGIWGVWGVFFAIPLATLIQAVINSWPRSELEAPKASEGESPA